MSKKKKDKKPNKDDELVKSAAKQLSNIFIEQIIKENQE